MSPDEPAPRFEQAIEDLERIIERIESGETPLDESLKQFEQGMALVNRCREVLDAVEKRIAELSIDSPGELKATEPP
jgi:exodeoxyribonuclease VII small subunit